MASITVINGSNIFARNAIRKLTEKFQKITLCDFRPYRQSVYELQKELELKQIQLNKVQLVGKLCLQREISKAENLLYFAHDYATMTSDNQSNLSEFALSSIEFPRQIVCVWPLEYHHFATYNSNLPNPKLEAEKALKLNPNLVVLQPNLIFGVDSYACKFLMKRILGRNVLIPSTLNTRTYAYKPIHYNDVISVMEHAMKNEKAKGKLFAINGSKKLFFEELLQTLSSQLSVERYSKHTYNPIKQFLERLVIGRTHENRMIEMFKYLENYPNNGELGNDYYEAFNLMPKVELSADAKIDLNEQMKIISPPLLHYKHYALD